MEKQIQEIPIGKLFVEKLQKEQDEMKKWKNKMDKMENIFLTIIGSVFVVGMAYFMFRVIKLYSQVK